MANDKLVKLTGADIKTFSVTYKWRRKERTSINSCRRTIKDKDFAGSLFVYIIKRKLQFRGEKQYLTSSLHSFVKYCFNHSKLIKFLSSPRRVVSFIYASKEWRFIVYFILLLFFNKWGTHALSSSGRLGESSQICTAFLSPSCSKVGYSHYPPDKKIPKVGNKSLTNHQSRYPLDLDLPAFVLNTH